MGGELKQGTRWVLWADLYDPREVSEVWPAGSIVSVDGFSLLKGGEVRLKMEKTEDQRWIAMEALERALKMGAIAPAGTGQ